MKSHWEALRDMTFAKEIYDGIWMGRSSVKAIQEGVGIAHVRVLLIPCFLAIEVRGVNTLGKDKHAILDSVDHVFGRKLQEGREYGKSSISSFRAYLRNTDAVTSFNMKSTSLWNLLCHAQSSQQDLYAFYTALTTDEWQPIVSF